MNVTWTQSWDDFVSVLNEHVQSHDDFEGLAATLTGHSVVWSGTVEKVDLDDVAPLIYIAFPPRQIAFRDGRIATLEVISVPIADGDRSSWNTVTVGQRVTFEAVLGSRASIFPTISVKTFKSGKTLVTVSLVDGRLR